MEQSEFYNAKLKSEKSIHDGLKKSDRIFSMIRLLVGASMLISLYFSLLQRSVVFGMIVLIVTVGFIAAVVLHNRLRKKLLHQSRMLDVINEELLYLNGDLSGFEDGGNFKDPEHLYTEDLDVFGKGSLYQRIARVFSAEAKKRLANRLKDNGAQIDLDHQATVKELSAMAEWRIQYRALAHGLVTDDLYSRIRNWIDFKSSKSLILNPIISWGLSTLFPIAVGFILITGRFDMIDWLLIPFGLNLYLFSRQLKSLRKDQGFIDKISGDLDSHKELLELILAQKWSSKTLNELQFGFKQNGQDATEILRKLSKIASRLDSLNNMFGASVFNGMFLYHLHVYRSLLDWKKEHGIALLAWLDVQAEMEVWVGLASFAFNNPDFVYPEPSDTPELSAKQIGHPFINKNNRITNDLTFDGFKLVILTGSNMAGKSTFLRSLGINIILSKLGLPVCAKAMRLPQMKLMTSMKPQDSLNDNQSYFQAEIERLKVLVDDLDKGMLSFILLDEILRGTNSEDKRNGTIGFLEKINPKHLMGLIATHDIEIAELTSKSPTIYSNKYFESYQKDGDLVFDYILRDGVCHTPNATQLMKMKGII